MALETEEDDAPVLPRRRMAVDTEMDMTPMIDCTFLLLIFFTVGAKLEDPAMVNLPQARYGKGVDPAKCVIITVAMKNEKGEAEIYLADGKKGAPLSGSPEDQAEKIKQRVEEGLLDNPPRTNVLIKSENRVLHREIVRVATAAAQEGITFNLAVMEQSENK
jgi:biopolymer transport protein ExbD